MLGIYAETDSEIPRDLLLTFVSAAIAAGAEVDLPASHGFLDVDRAAYDATQAARAWLTIRAFLEGHSWHRDKDVALDRPTETLAASPGMPSDRPPVRANASDNYAEQLTMKLRIEEFLKLIGIEDTATRSLAAFHLEEIIRDIAGAHDAAAHDAALESAAPALVGVGSTAS